MQCRNKIKIKERIKNNSDLLNEVSQKIWQNPEIKFEEFKAHDLLCNVLEKQEFKVQRQYILPTAFRAEYSGEKPGPVIGILCEYDALPLIGHACGHNLIAESSLGAALGLKAAVEGNPAIPGKIVVLGTPAEEAGAGKVKLIAGGAFKDIDIAMLIHPAPYDYLYTPFIGRGWFDITYHGKEAHASGYPWEGKNAVDAAVACWNNIALLRQHIKPTCRVHGIIKYGGAAANIIPSKSELWFLYRAATTRDMKDLKQRLEACFTSAATATGCKIDLVHQESEYCQHLITNKVLANIYKKYAEEMGVKFEDGNYEAMFMASSDMGNVSHVVPSIHPCVGIDTKAPNHSPEFTEAAGSPKAQPFILKATEVLALVGLEVMTNPKILEEAKKQFKHDIDTDI